MTDINREFRALTGGFTPLKWQCRLFSLLKSGVLPRTCTLPTGVGKTSVISIWLIALAGGASLPRRLAYIVNRRTVVDQASDATRAMRAKLCDPDDPRWAEHSGTLRDLGLRLSRLAGAQPSEEPLAVSTLRGELADNGEWKLNPARPAIIIGTIDMIGSKMLFAGYGDGRYGRAHHAGLIGQDSLIVHDEAHLSPAFDSLLHTVAAEQLRCCDLRPIRVMSLSATARARADGESVGDSTFGLDDDDREDALVESRLNATKLLRVVDAEKGTIPSAIAERALGLGQSPARVLVYVRSPEVAAEVAKAIKKGLGEGGDARVAILTGTIRGFERDALAKGPILSGFWSNPQREPLAQSLFLVSTSAGEVGADFDADHLVCDLSTLDSMAQRFGRVNRLGGDGRSASVVVVAECADAKDEKPPGESAVADGSTGAEEGKPARGKRALSDCEAAVLKTGKILRGIVADGGDVSPAALAKLIHGLTAEDRQAAFSPTPTILPATDILFDHWSLTSIADEMPGRPTVEPYLHGVAEWEPPETHVAWRADITLLASAGGTDVDGQPVPCPRDDLEEAFDAFPLRSAETLRDRTDRVQKQLQALAKRLREAGSGAAESQATDGEPEAGVGTETAPGVDENRPGPAAILPADPWVVLMRGGSVEWVRLSGVALADSEQAKQAQRPLAFATVVLPVEAGGLKNGMLVDTEPAPLDASSLDVAETPVAGNPVRQRVRVDASDDGGTPLLGGATIDAIARHSVVLAGGEDADAGRARIEYRIARGEEREPGVRVELSLHNATVGAAAERTAQAVGLSDELATAFRLAGEYHDSGKAREVWQRYALNWDAKEKRLRDDHPIAKSDRYGNWKMLGGYRHEFGSLLDASTADDLRSLDPDARDLVLHLIAAHHGWARPHFEPRHFDRGDPGKPRPTAQNQAEAVETMQRFARLQQRFGRWGLAWLESVLRCADAEASARVVAGDGATASVSGAER